MDYQIENKGPMTVIGVERRFSMENPITEIPKFWEEFFKNGWQRRSIRCWAFAWRTAARPTSPT